MAFRRIHAADLTAWNGKDIEPSFQALVDDLTAFLGPTAKKKQPPPKKKKSRRRALASNFEARSRLFTDSSKNNPSVINKLACSGLDIRET